MTIQIAQRSALELPLDFVTERIAFLARTGAGKSGGMRVLAEEFIAAGQFVIHLDLRAGDAWGIRAGGTGPGLPVMVMGGENADIPLQPSSGEYVAKLLAKERISTVLDLSDFSKADAVRFVTAFAHAFYRANRDVVHLFIDEADVVAGERFFDPKCLEAIQYIQTKGRKRGIGVTVSTQRTAIINKTVLSQSGTYIVMQTTGARDLAAIREMLQYVADKKTVDEIIGALPTLETREAFVYSPQLIGGAPKRIKFKSFQTFDSMRTPRPGEARQKPKSLASIDLGKVEADMAATIEEAKANDPQLLKAEVSRLEKIHELAQLNGDADVSQLVTADSRGVTASPLLFD
ncbi:MAG: ATP-binding protein [Pirellulales bacterium]|nr:ATP-binding protein [Pirellulales bacterium]